MDEKYAQHSFTNTNMPTSTIARKKKGLSAWTSEEEEREELRKRAFYPKGELPGAHPMFPDPPANKNDPAFRGQEMKATDDTATDLFKKKLLEEHLVVSPSLRKESNALLFHSLRDLYAALLKQRQRTGILSPKSFMENLRQENEMFRQNIHHDAHEFLNYMLNSVHDGYSVLTHKNALKDTTFVHTIFEGTLASEVRCLTCENITSRDESFLDLSLDIEENTSVSACMRAFSASEFLREKNKFFCEKCNGLQEAERRMKIRKLPQVLALHLKRFKFEPEIQRHVKLQHVVRYETTLRLSNTTDDATDPDRLYELYAVVIHLGGQSYHGHYIACVRTDHLGWVLFDDEHVERIPDSVVMRFIGGEDSGTACAYVLFYRTVDIEEPLESRAALALPADSIHASQMPAEVVPIAAHSSAANGIPHSPGTPTSPNNFPSTVPLQVPQDTRERKNSAERLSSSQGANNSLSPPQAAYMKRAGLNRSSTNTSTSSTAPRPTARRVLSNVFSSNNSNASSPPATSPGATAAFPVNTNNGRSLTEVRPKSAIDSSPTNSSVHSVGRPASKGMSISIPSYIAEKQEHHGPYTGTVITSTPMEEEEEPVWNPQAAMLNQARPRPQRPTLGEKKSTGLSRFSSFRGKRNSFFGGKKDDENATSEVPVSKEEKTRRRGSVFGMGQK